MMTLAQLRAWWAAITHSARVHSDVATELQFHLDAYTHDLVQRGMPEEEARRRARLEMGQVNTQNERYRESIGLRFLDEISGDVRFGLRSIARQPVSSVVAVLSLALGIGATTAMFSLIYAVLIHPFPYADSERIMNPAVINEERPQQPTWFATTKPQFETLGHAGSIESLLGFRNVNMELTGEDLPEDVNAIYLTENAGSFFGVRALLGRGIVLSDAQGGGQPIVVLNYKFWQRHYYGIPDVLGRTLVLDHVKYTIVGVMPRSFAFNDTLGVGDVYLPRSLLHDSVTPPIAWPYTPWIKLKPNVTLATANAELGAIVRQFAHEHPERFPKKFHLQLQPILVPFAQNTRHALLLLLAGVLLLLVIGCANCSILLLARGQARQHELAIRRAIGAGRWRIIRQLLVEAMMISFSGALLGVAGSYWLASLPLQLSPGSFPAESFIRINLPLLAFSVGLAVACGILFGLVPSLRLSRSDLAPAMQSSKHRIAGYHSRQRLNVLIAGQIVLTLLLMATAGTAIGAFLRLTKVPLGYDPGNVMQVGIVLHFNDPKEWEHIKLRADRAAFIEHVRQKIASVPGVISAAVGTDATPPYSGVERPFDIADKANSEGQAARVHLVSPEFFATLRIPLLSGHIWNEAENTRGDFLAVVNESFARRYWPHQNPIEEQVRLPSMKSGNLLEATSSESGGWRQVIGVVGDARDDGLDRPVVPAIYVPYTTYMAPYAQFEVRTQGEPLALAHSIRAAVQDVSPDQQIGRPFDLQESIENDSQWSRQRLFSVLFGFFSALALLLAIAGLFSVVSYSVAQRTAEFGIRMALGAPQTHILWIAARVGIASALTGTAVGMLVDLFLGRVLARWMDSGLAGFASLPHVALLLVICTFAACLLPARRAAAIHPASALRSE
jgi:predicted permease